MSIPNYDLPTASIEVSSGTPTHLYLLQMDSSFNQRVGDSHIFPLHILNHSADFSQSQFLLPIQTKAGEGGDQLEVFMDEHQEPAKYSTLEREASCEQSEKQSLSTVECVKSKQLMEDLSETQLVAPMLVQSNVHHDIAFSHQMTQSYIHIPDRNVLPRAIAVLPSVLQIRKRDVIAPRRTLPSRTRFGPVIGVKHKMSCSEADELVITATMDKTPLFVQKEENETITHIDVSDRDKSNWIGLLPLGDENTANVWIYEENNELYIITTEAIQSRKQLMLGYSKKYAQEFGLIGPIKDIETESVLNAKSWWCYECHRALPSPTQLQRHMNAYHQEYKPIKRRRYRCRNCMLTFSRLFALRRHVAHNCKKKLDKSENIITSDTLPETSLNSTLNTDENRVPSDESFQNYSNGLDFPTNLFDTDRIPNLDMSGNSRSEVFNPYILEAENTLANDLGYVNGSLDKTDNSTNNDVEKNYVEQHFEASPLSCPYCNQNIIKGKRRRHVSECPARRFECECKKVFTNKELLAHHIYTEHTNDEQTSVQGQTDVNTTTDLNTIEDPKPYKCDQCQHAFKRRGMLINHLWRKHDTVSARVPLERRVRHYPCVACPKLYRTATKRDRHVQLHHPGVSRAGARSVEGGSRTCSPAACPACPREYATRAKMLQHMRRHHPHMVATVPKKVNMTKKSNTKVQSNNGLEASEDRKSVV